MITNIEITKIFPHPDNPRKDLGDLSELAASIKVNGIFQNLTVVPDYDSDKNEPERYMAVIGHRRLSAARLAGLTEVPCVISDMDHKKQVSTMMLENMQRSDLTIWEQAQGFQMMLNFGESVEEISTQTGFSESTIRRRVKLLDLDKDKFQKSVERGATLQEYAELDKIKDIKIKNGVLEKIGTPDYRWALQSAIEKEKSEANKTLLIEELKKFATQVEKPDGLRSVQWYSYHNKTQVQKPEDADDKQYFFVVTQYHIQLLEEATEAGPEVRSAVSEESRQEQERRSRLDEISKRAFQLRRDFIRNYTGGKKHIREIMAFAVRSIVEGYGFSYGDEAEVMEMLGIKYDGEDEDEDDGEEFTFNTVASAFEVSPEKVLLITAYCSAWNTHEKYYDWQGSFVKNTGLDTLYDLLEKIGYEMSDEEKALHDGTHELYREVYGNE